jgi:hypothetical protein
VARTFKITCHDGEQIRVPPTCFEALMRLSNETGVGPGCLWRIVSGCRGERPPTRRLPDDA